MAKKSSKSKNPALGKTCELLGVDEVLPQLFIKGTKAGINEFQLVAGPKIGDGISSFKITFKDGMMQPFWKDRVFMARGNARLGAKSLRSKPTSQQIDTAWEALTTKLHSSSISAQRLECDTKVPVTGAQVAGTRHTKKKFGSLRLYQVPNKSKRLFFATFATDGNPDGSGGGGVGHN